MIYKNKNNKLSILFVILKNLKLKNFSLKILKNKEILDYILYINNIKLLNIIYMFGFFFIKFKNLKNILYFFWYISFLNKKLIYQKKYDDIFVLNPKKARIYKLDKKYNIIFKRIKIYFFNLYILKNHNCNFKINLFYKKFNKPFFIKTINWSKPVFFNYPSSFILVFYININLLENFSSPTNYKLIVYSLNDSIFTKKIFIFKNFLLYSLNFNILLWKKFFFFFYKKIKFNYNYLIFLNDFKNFKKKVNFFSSNYLINYYIFFDLLNKNTNYKYINSSKNIFLKHSNYYPLVNFEKKIHNSFFKFFKKTYNSNYTSFLNKFLIGFFELFFKKNIFLKIDNNFFYKIKNENFNIFLKNYKNYKPKFFRNFSLETFLEIIWYSFLLKDLNMLSDWITTFMESLTFKDHKKFIFFFQNLIQKNSRLFINCLSIKGFFFDIRGKVGVTGSSKKRHICFKIGCLKKSSKKNKIDLNQNLVRTYSGVMGLTYIISY